MKAKVSENPDLSFIDIAANISLTTTAIKALTASAAVVLIIFARIVSACCNACRFSCRHLSSLTRIYRLQLIALSAVASWVERHVWISRAFIAAMAATIFFEALFLSY